VNKERWQQFIGNQQRSINAFQSQYQSTGCIAQISLQIDDKIFIFCYPFVPIGYEFV
jgi:hypothetical protein